jgi:hypothetical protein
LMAIAGSAVGMFLAIAAVVLGAIGCGRRQGRGSTWTGMREGSERSCLRRVFSGRPAAERNGGVEWMDSPQAG